MQDGGMPADQDISRQDRHAGDPGPRYLPCDAAVTGTSCGEGDEEDPGGKGGIARDPGTCIVLELND